MVNAPSHAPSMADPARSSRDQAFHALVDQSLEVLRNLLQDGQLSPLERAEVALRILALAQGEGRSPGMGGESLDLNRQLLTLVGDRPANGTKNELSPSDADKTDETDNSDTGGLDNSLVGAAASGNGVAGAAVVSKSLTWNIHSEIIAPRYVKIDNFLSPEENKRALVIALDNHSNFVESNTTTNANNYRQSSVLYATHYTELYHLLRKRILKQMPSIVKELGMDSFLVSQVEMQMTAHGDGCFYKIHNDSGSADTASRVLTYVYYFHREPKTYSGGALRIYETDIHGPATEPSELFEDVIPENNSIVLFDSRVKHEVLPVACASHAFEDSRFTLNGWLRRV
ncbi:MAG: 2OG-Fe(II) oxygenase [Cyanobacteria bacterium P01_H01_bin.130]